ncbi:hypothetical protein P280DRAFT_464741 [Massarina eburnea CBS 473.64]|uniref:DUF1330 domain-containing protein n=1 Tax=Massarina eburnea CBS 473.64 TaxID=1395130 RepID=A0A6A6SFC2_9PLEO|nr:hypothetical protein P280DRAFT_464741 [Massarina eburnea CBS 473.64]
MPVVPLDHEILASLATTYNPTRPVYMLNLWKYRTEAKYAPGESALAGEPCSGREASNRYITAITPLMPKDFELHFTSSVAGLISAPEGEQHWDTVEIVKYPTLEGFRKMMESKEYLETAQPHRVAALEDFRLIMLDKMG